MTDPREPWNYSSGGRHDWRIDPDPLQVDDDPFKQEWTNGYSEPYATVDEGNPGMVIVWMLGAIVAALIVAVAWLAWTR